MKSVLKEKWLQALRSGEYSQGYGYLKREDRYCCLGVLAVCAEGPQVFEEIPNTQGVFGLKNVRKFSTLPADFANLPQKLHDELTKLNDKGIPFSAIADWIETHVLTE